MKRFGLLLAVLFGIGVFVACDKHETTHSYDYQIPVLEKMSSIRAKSILIREPKPISNSGKIYLFKEYLLINEPNEGIHIFDNSNPASPKALNFISIPGNVDMAVNDNMLYADSYVDLIVVDISNPSTPDIIERIEDVFPTLYVGMEGLDIVKEYRDTTITYKTESTGWGWGGWIANDGSFMNSGGSESSFNGGGNYGTGGSMARFTLSKGHLYTVNQSQLRLFDVKNAKKPTYVKDILLGWGIETIFPFKDMLFIGSNRGMYIYDIVNPGDPQQLSVYEHVVACDPVVVNDKYAFVTLRTGNFCMGTTDVLEVIDIEDPTAPELIKSYDMQNPHGLGLAGDYLYLCEGKHGLKSFNVSDVMAIDENQLEHLKNMHSVDVIPGPNSLIVVGEDGVCQYDYSDKEKLHRLSCIPRFPKAS